jgi:hypothetical protein
MSCGSELAGTSLRLVPWRKHFSPAFSWDSDGGRRILRVSIPTHNPALRLPPLTRFSFLKIGIKFTLEVYDANHKQ